MASKSDIVCMYVQNRQESDVPVCIPPRLVRYQDYPALQVFQSKPPLFDCFVFPLAFRVNPSPLPFAFSEFPDVAVVISKRRVVATGAETRLCPLPLSFSLAVPGPSREVASRSVLDSVRCTGRVVCFAGLTGGATLVGLGLWCESGLWCAFGQSGTVSDVIGFSFFWGLEEIGRAHV